MNELGRPLDDLRLESVRNHSTGARSVRNGNFSQRAREERQSVLPHVRHSIVSENERNAIGPRGRRCSRQSTAPALAYRHRPRRRSRKLEQIRPWSSIVGCSWFE